MLALRYYIHTEVLPDLLNATSFIWWYGEDDAKYCEGLLKFLGFRESLNVLCEPAVAMNSRETGAFVMGLSKNVGSQRERHGINRVKDDLAALEDSLPPGAVHTLGKRVLRTLPPIAMKKWAAAYGINIKGSEDLKSSFTGSLRWILGGR